MGNQKWSPQKPTEAHVRLKVGIGISRARVKQV